MLYVLFNLLNELGTWGKEFNCETFQAVYHIFGNEFDT